MNADAEAALATELDFFKNKKPVVKKAVVKKTEKKKRKLFVECEDKVEVLIKHLS